MKRIQLTAACLSVLISATLSAAPASAAPPSGQPALRFVPHTSAVPGGGARIDVFLDAAQGVAGYELVATVNGNVANLAGADSRSAQTESAGFHDVSISGQEDAAVLAAYSPSGSTLSGQVRLGTFFIESIRPGLIQARIGAVRIVGADGAILSAAGQGGSLISLGTGPTAAAVPAARWRLPNAASRAASQVRRPDPELELSWQTLRLSTQPCGASALGLDVTGDGCLDVGDLVLNGRAGDGRTPTTQTAQSQPGPTATTSAAVFVVNSVSDEWDQNVGNSICRTASGECSLRAAIQEANATAGPNQIDFAIPGGGVRTIQLLRKLPALNDASGGTFVNGYSQPGSTPNTDPVIDNALIMIEIRGNGAANFDALPITSAYNTVRGLSMYNARRELWIYGPGATHNTVAGNFIGTDSTGTFVTPAIQLDAMGIKVEQDAADNMIGGTSPADRNVVSGNGRQGIALWHNKTDRTVVQNNIVGLNPDGTRRVPNRKHGIDLNFGASESQIGGTGSGERNVVSGNDDDGVEISHTALTANNTVSGNYIGSDVTGNAGSAITANANVGIYVEDGVTANIIVGNVIVNNTLGGVVVINGGSNGASTGNVFRDNRIGVGLGGARLGNGAFGVTVNGTGNTVGPDNIIRFNNGPGVQVTQTDATANKITQNVITDNQGLSIDLSPVGQVNPNDPGDADTGANAKLNYPEPFRAANNELSGSACPGCTIEVYKTGTAIGNGPARTYAGSARADSTGSFVFASSAPAGTSFSAVAIDASGNTSEMAPNVTMQDANAAPTIDAGSDVSVNEGGSTRLEATTADP
ncbi:MAG: Ig-like domain-containing protein, partial [Chloroflexota bacterium]|nr:Ig-like domain-containing protein [Chloroflexota bacterium]